MAALDNVNFAGWLIKATWQASLVVLLVLLIQWALRRQLPPRWRYFLWVVVLLRLALPISPPSSLSIYNWVNLSPPTLGAVPNPGSSASTFDAHGLSLQTALIPAADPSTVRLLVFIWLAGALLLFGKIVLSYIFFSRCVAQIRPVTHSGLLNLLEDCKELMNVRTPVTLLETDSVQSPALLGLLRPRILLPSGLVSEFKREEIRFIFLHELAHLKRNDIAAGWVMTVLHLLHWFNPVLWVAFARMRFDRELACDSLVLRYAGEGARSAYAKTIIKLIELYGTDLKLAGRVGFLETTSLLKERIRFILGVNRNGSRPWGYVPAFVLLSLLALTDAEYKEPDLLVAEAFSVPFRDRSTQLASQDLSSSSLRPTSEAAPFYEELARHGKWVDINGSDLVWKPVVSLLDPAWRPFVHGGKWLYTEEGWYWHSAYDWGWAVFHYGRWFQHDDHGWVWQPGVDWSPAWVEWRETDREAGWRPLPSDRAVRNAPPPEFFWVCKSHFTCEKLPVAEVFPLARALVNSRAMWPSPPQTSSQLRPLRILTSESPHTRSEIDGTRHVVTVRRLPAGNIAGLGTAASP
jgi:bla regulator protein BlaR1